MSTAADREHALIKEARDLCSTYVSNGQPAIVRLFAEDYNFLLRRHSIVEFHGAARLDGDISVVKGAKKLKRYTKKPPEVLL